MKFAIVFAAVLAIVAGQDAETETTAAVETSTQALVLDGETSVTTPMTRDLPADVLRDFLGLCFASTLCRVFEIGQSWELTPFCGSATCVLSPDGFLIERVNDCGLLPKPNPSCKIINEDAKNKTFPDCCPLFQCEKGITLEYPTQAELQASQAEAAAATELGTPASTA